MKKAIIDVFSPFDTKHIQAYRQYRQKKSIDVMQSLFGGGVEYPVGWQIQIDTRLADIYLDSIQDVVEITFRERVEEAIIQLSICMDLVVNFPIIADSIRMIIKKLNFIKEVI